MFKVGDKVRRTYGTSGGMNIDDIGTVKKILNEEWMVLEEYGDQHAIDRFELVEDKVLTREELIQKLSEDIIKIGGSEPNQELNRAQRYMEQAKYEIDRYTNYLKEEWKKYREFMLEVETLKNMKPKDFKDDIEALLNHKYVKDVNSNVRNSSIVITTDYIDIYDEEDNKFKGNKYSLKFDFNKMTCYITGLDTDYNRKSYWTEFDPHPHVNGDTGEACWGSAGCMLTENMNNYEVYASFIVVLNFLQQVNTEDPAGKYIANWDCIDEEGYQIENPHEMDVVYCTCCDYEMERGDAFYCEDCQNYMCDDHAYYIEYGNKYVCDECFENEYVTCENCSDRMHIDDEDRRIHDDYDYCSSCFNELFRVCSHCDTAVEKEETSTIDGEDYCDECYDELFRVCDECGDTRRIEETFYCNSCNTLYCEDCEEETIPGMCKTCYEEDHSTDLETVSI